MRVRMRTANTAQEVGGSAKTWYAQRLVGGITSSRSQAMGKKRASQVSGKTSGVRLFDVLQIDR
jgi:hypothetical protein